MPKHKRTYRAFLGRPLSSESSPTQVLQPRRASLTVKPEPHPCRQSRQDVVSGIGNEVRVYRHVPDFENLELQVAVRMGLILNTESPSCLYVNPLCSVLCDAPDAEFFETARRFQGQWCRQARSTFIRQRTRRTRDWVSMVPGSNEPKRRQKYFRYLERAVVFTGLLFVNGKIVPARQWPTMAPAVLPLPDTPRTGNNKFANRNTIDISLKPAGSSEHRYLDESS